MWSKARGLLALANRPTRKHSVDHADGVLNAVDRHERAEARALLLAQQHLVAHVDPVDLAAGLAVLGLDLAGLVEERLAPADVVDHLLDLLRRGVRRQPRLSIAQIIQRRALALAGLAILLLRQHEV